MRKRRVLATLVLGSLLAIPVAAAGDDYEFPEDVAVPGQKDRFHPPVRLTAADGVIDSGKSWGHCGPWVEDVDGDGVRDLVVGDFSGFFLYFRNEGTNKEPKYAKSTRLQAGGEDAKVPIY